MDSSEASEVSTQNSQESTNVFIPEEIAKNFKCIICQKYLFVPPIATNDGTSFRCGRCSFIKTTMDTPVYGFEKLASYMAFPCTFEGCTLKLPWSKIDVHESICKYRIMSCPCYHCDDLLPMNKLVHHFEEQHKKYICMGQCTVRNRNIKQPHRCLMRVLLFNGEPYLMFHYRNENIFWVSVYSVGTPKRNLSFEINFTSLNGKYSVTSHNEKLVTFNEQEHCINCLDKECRSRFHKFSQLYETKDKIYENMTSAMNIENLVSSLGSEHINWTVRLVQKSEEDPNLDLECKTDSMLFLLQNLECPICKNLMSSPIYNCLTGHTLCKDCRNKVMKCPQCKQPLTDSRCFALEDIADKVNLSCKNKKAGCKFSGNVDEYVEHEKICNIIF